MPDQLRSTNLPAPLTSFVGREKEKSYLAELLPRTRLLTLTGPGGCGKTRLALEVAREALGNRGDRGQRTGDRDQGTGDEGGHAGPPLPPFPVGADLRVRPAADVTRSSSESSGLSPESFESVWFVELAPLADGTLVAQAIASALALHGEPHRTFAETLVDHLVPQRLLLVLDNCEHLVAAVAPLVENLLRACPGVAVLTTSREPLRIEGELVWRVPALALPEPLPLPSWGSLIESEAVRLFVERARAGQPSFRLTEESAAAVAAICRRLDGIPLALELAAARTRVLSVQQLADRLSDRFRLLNRGSRTALPRQQTLQAAVDWSYDLLTQAEQALFRCLSVFPGGFSLEAAETIGRLGDRDDREQGTGNRGQGTEGIRPSKPSAHPLPSPLPRGEGITPYLTQSSVPTQSSTEPWSVLNLLEMLVDKSLVQAEERGRGMRFRLLETLREYGRGRLLEAGETQAALARHAAYYQALAEMAVPNLLGPDDELNGAIERLEAEHDNLRVALQWFAGRSEDEQGLRLAGALWRFWYFRGYITEARSWLARFLPGSTRGVPGPRARALEGAGVLAWHAGDYAAARAYAEEALALQDEIGDDAGAAWSLNCLGLVALYEHDYPRACALLESTLARQRQLGDPIGIAGALLNLGAVARDQGDYEAARPLIEEALAIFKAAPDLRGVAFCLHNLGLLLEAEEPEAAAALQQEGLRIRQELGDPQVIFESLIGLAGLVGAQGRPERAARLFAALDSLRRAGDLPLQPFYRCYLDQHLDALHTDLDDSAFGAAWEEGATITRDEAIAQVLETAPADESAGASSRTTGVSPAHRTLAGETPVVPALADEGHFQSAPAATGIANPDHLSEREVEVLRLIAAGRSNRQIAGDLVLSVHTVERHIANIYRKIGAHGKASATAYALRHGLLQRV